MSYADTFRNTFLVDILEGLGLVHPSSNFVPQKAGANAIVEKTDKPDDESAIGGVLNASAEREEEVPNAVDSDSDASRSPTVDAAPVDPFLVDWNGPDDPENPQNWPGWKKIFVVTQTMMLTCSTYMGASIYTPGQTEIQDEFHVGHVVGTLNLSMYVLGYGLGPMIFSPLSEELRIGRNRIYIFTLFLFFILQIPIALVDNIAGLVILRFLTGVLSSPAISTGGATLGDIVDPSMISRMIGLWAVSAVAAPVVAPLLGAAMVVAKNWRWIFWLLAMICGFTLAVMVAFMPETLHSNVLYRRAQRIRKETGDNRYHTAQEVAEQNKEWKSSLAEIVYRPFAMILSEPGILAFDIYIALVYGAFYLFFEAFPLVFVGIYNFTLIEVGLAYMGFCVGCVIAYLVLIVFLNTIIDKRTNNGTYSPEHYLILAMWVCFLLPASLFIFGWTAGVHWILPIISEMLFVIAAFNIFQCGFGYLARSYPRYMASVFAGNALVRSSFASAFPLFGQAMYDRLGSPKFPVGWGSTLLGFIALAMAVIPFVLYRFGSLLRGRSKYAN